MTTAGFPGSITGEITLVKRARGVWTLGAVVYGSAGDETMQNAGKIEAKDHDQPDPPTLPLKQNYEKNQTSS
jgi:hypothetical protein